MYEKYFYDETIREWVVENLQNILDRDKRKYHEWLKTKHLEDLIPEEKE